MARPVWFNVMPPNVPVTSMYPTAMARELFLVMFRYCEIRGGIITRKAWGRMTRFIIRPGRRPSEAAASVWPLDTA